MPSILDILADAARCRVRAAAHRVSQEELASRLAKRRSQYTFTPFAFEKALRSVSPTGDALHVICECKKASPSKGLIASHYPYVDIAHSYEQAGATALSVLTEPTKFLGADHHLEEVAREVSIPCLRKDFTVDPYQIYEAAYLGAQAVLLICSLLSDDELECLLQTASDVGLSALVETHSAEEIKRAERVGATVVGVNNRNLADFSVDVSLAERLREKAHPDMLFIAESGIRSAQEVARLREAGVTGILVGETLMRADDRGQALRDLLGVSV